MENKLKLNIYQKLLTIQQEVMGLGKNKKGNSFEYVTGSKVLEFIKPLMNKHGLILKQEVISIDNVRQDYKTGIGTAYEKPKSEINSKVMMKFTWVDCETGDKDENLFGANGQNDWDKGVGSALTYGERYFLLKYFHIATDEDDIDNPDLKKEDIKPNIATPIKQKLEKPYLNKGTDEWNKAVEYLKTPNGTIDKIISKYQLTLASQEILIREAK